MNKELTVLPKDAVFALDIGTRSVIGMLGFLEGDKMRIAAVRSQEHEKRAMIDGQIENIAQVAKVARSVREAMEQESGYSLKRVYVAAAGRALRTSSAAFEMTFPETRTVDEETINRLETGAIEEAQKTFSEDEEHTKRFFLVGYTVSQYYLDDYPISSLLGHRCQKLRADIVATFLPGEVVESLYAAMQQADMEVAGLTLEPIAAMNAAIPDKLRLLNLVMVDIGAGTSDIAVCKNGRVVGYTMATLAGDEITEALVQAYLVDFDTAEQIKLQLGEKEEIIFTDILGCEQRHESKAILELLEESVQKLAKEISDRILEVNGGRPSAVFLAGGGSHMVGLPERITECLGIPAERASVAGRYYAASAFSDKLDLERPELATPLGIVVSAGLNLINDSFSVKLNGMRAKLFSNGMLRLSDVLMMNGYRYKDMIGRSGASLIVSVNGERAAFYGEPANPALIQINGEDAALSDPVHAGDEITFIAAQSGKPAQALISDLKVDGDVARWFANGEEVSESYALKYGDVITALFEGEEPPEEIREFSEQPQEIFAEPEPPARRTPLFQEPKEPAVPLPELSFELNGKTRIFAPKPDGQPYFLMDILEYAGLDMEHLTSPVTLRVNGEPAQFQQEIKPGDVVNIFEDKSVLIG